MAADPTKRFSDRVADYVRWRPGYPPESIDLLARRCGWGQGSRIADIGSGTGILTQLLLESGAEVFGIEPNAPMREAAEAMGATKWQVIVKVVLPAAKNGLLGAVLLGVGRGFGETMAVLMASGHAINIPDSIFDSVRALTATIAAELGETPMGSDHYQALFTLGILLFVVTFMINLAADLVVRGVQRQK